MIGRAMARIAVIGDYDEAITAHRANPLALAAAGNATGEWIHTSKLGNDVPAQLRSFDGVWVVPGSPYANTEGALAAIEFARTSGLPFLGTCGGFQHAMIEYARGVWGVLSPAHAETDPDAEDPVITPLACSLVEARESIHFEAGSELRRIYGKDSTTEEYRCRFGLSPRYAERLSRGDLRVAARDERGDVVGVELTGHPFFVAVLFQPERAGLRGEASPLISAFVNAADAAHAPPGGP
jgi:CTP synthase (UTP-ammonia lyase)